MNEIKPIVLKVQSTEDCVGVVRPSPEAEKVVRRLHSRCHLTIRQIVSEIIVQAEHLISIEQDEDD